MVTIERRIRFVKVTDNHYSWSLLKSPVFSALWSSETIGVRFDSVSVCLDESVVLVYLLVLFTEVHHVQVVRW